MRRGAPALRMVDWSEPEEEYDGAGADRGQINKSTATGNVYSLLSLERYSVGGRWHCCWTHFHGGACPQAGAA